MLSARWARLQAVRARARPKCPQRAPRRRSARHRCSASSEEQLHAETLARKCASWSAARGRCCRSSCAPGQQSAHPFVLLLAHVAVQRDDARLGLDVDADELMDPEPDDPGTGQHGRTGDAPKRVVLLSATVNSTKKESERVCTRIPMCMARPRQRVTSCTFVALKSRRGEVPRNACTWLVL